MKIIYLLSLTFLFLQCAPTSSQSQQSPIDNRTPQKDKISENRSWRFAVISDLNGSYGSKTYSSDVKRAIDYLRDPKNKIGFAISTGDMVAGQKSGLDYAGMWEAFQSNVTRPLKKAQIALYPSPGNHDAYITRKTEREHYKRSWQNEDILNVNSEFKFVAGVEQNYPFSYAFTLGPALFIALDNTNPVPFETETIEWLEQILEKNRHIKHKFIYGHIPLLPFAFKKTTEFNVRNSLSFLNRIEDLLEEYQVSVYLSGHSHVYYPGQRHGSTQFLSVPLLGGGPRYLLTKNQTEPRSQHGFVIIEFDENNIINMETRRSDNFNVIKDSELPEMLTLPKSNSSLCSNCSQFPESYFLNSQERSLYYRRDL